MFKTEVGKFFEKYPNFCTECGATGVVSYMENLGPTGEVWICEMQEPCPECAALYECPLCGLLELDEETGLGKCSDCGWTAKPGRSFPAQEKMHGIF